MIISKTVRFEAGHALHGLEPGHKCSNVHGHNYVVTVKLYGEDLGATGMVVDFGVINKAIRDKFDHALLLHREHPLAKLLSMFFGTAEQAWPSGAPEFLSRWCEQQRYILLDVSPTAENIAIEIADTLLKLSDAESGRWLPLEIVVHENEESFAIWTAEPEADA